MLMAPVKISLIGAGSAAFGIETLYDIASSDEFKKSTIVLIDIDVEKLKIMHKVAERFSEAFNADLKIESYTNTKEGLDGSNFVFISVEKERMKRWWLDYTIPFKYGVKQAMGECGGPGGLAHTLRQVPLIIEICRDIEDACPNSFVINYSNPESRVTYAIKKYTKLNAIGLCHGIYGRMSFISMILGKGVEAFAAGINHFTWILKLWYKENGKDAYPDLKRILRDVSEFKIKPEDLNRLPESQRRAIVIEPLSRELCLTFGYYPSPGDNHVAEFLACGWNMLEPYERGDEWLKGYENMMKGVSETTRKIALGEMPAKTYKPPSFRGKGVEIMKALITNRKYFEYAVNIKNDGVISNLPQDAIVEVPAKVDGSGFQPIYVGQLPSEVAALIYPQTIIQKLSVEAGYEGSYEKALEALLIDPVVNIRIEEAKKLLDELIGVHLQLLPQFKKR